MHLFSKCVFLFAIISTVPPRKHLLITSKNNIKSRFKASLHKTFLPIVVGQSSCSHALKKTLLIPTLWYGLFHIWNKQPGSWEVPKAVKSSLPNILVVEVAQTCLLPVEYSRTCPIINHADKSAAMLWLLKRDINNLLWNQTFYIKYIFSLRCKCRESGS